MKVCRRTCQGHYMNKSKRRLHARDSNNALKALILLIAFLATACAKPFLRKEPATTVATTPVADKAIIAVAAPQVAQVSPIGPQIAQTSDVEPPMELLGLAQSFSEFALFPLFDNGGEGLADSSDDEGPNHNISDIVLAVKTQQHKLLVCSRSCDRARGRVNTGDLSSGEGPGKVPSDIGQSWSCVKPDRKFALSLQKLDQFNSSDKARELKKIKAPLDVVAFLEKANKTFEINWSEVDSKGSHMTLATKRYLANRRDVQVLNRWKVVRLSGETSPWTNTIDTSRIELCNAALRKAADTFTVTAAKLSPPTANLNWTRAIEDRSPIDDAALAATVSVSPGSSWRFTARADVLKNLIIRYDEQWTVDPRRHWLEQRIFNSLKLTIEVTTENAQSDPLVKAWSQQMRAALEQCHR
jgi:hypothetical protein